MSEAGEPGRTVVFLDDARLLPEGCEASRFVIVSLDSDAFDELGVRNVRARRLVDYAERTFVTYDQLYEHYGDAVRERLRPKDPILQSRFLFDALWDDILLNAATIQHVEVLIRTVLERERPARIVLAIADARLDLLIRPIVEQLDLGGR